MKGGKKKAGSQKPDFLEMDPGLRRDDGEESLGGGVESVGAASESFPDDRLGEPSVDAGQDAKHPGVQGEALAKALPVKSPDVVKRVVYLDVQKHVLAEDFIGIHEEVRRHFEGLRDLREALTHLKDEVRECRAGIKTEEEEINRLTAVIAGGVMELKDEKVIETWDYSVGSIASEAADREISAAMVAIPMREMLSLEKERGFNYKTPREDCYYCKYVTCRAAGQGWECLNFADCLDCPEIRCDCLSVVPEDGAPDFCGFEKRPYSDLPKTSRSTDEVMEEHRRRDCYFCDNLRCDADMTASCGRRSDCAECSSASCSNKISGADCPLDKALVSGMPF